MSTKSEAQFTFELPTHKFYYSYRSLSFDLSEDSNSILLFQNFSRVITPYYHSSLALLRGTARWHKNMEDISQKFDDEYTMRTKYLDEQREKQKDEEDHEDINYFVSQLSNQHFLFYEDFDLEMNMHCCGVIVQFLSLFESTLHLMYKNLKSLDSTLPNIASACERDKGIMRYLKYLDKSINLQSKYFIVGTEGFQSLYNWVKIRNNIVHNNNESTDKLLALIHQKQLDISLYRDKLIFKEENIRTVADICGEILDVLVNKLLGPYLLSKSR